MISRCNRHAPTSVWCRGALGLELTAGVGRASALTEEQEPESSLSHKCPLGNRARANLRAGSFDTEA
eukprot:1652233-Rhodomonas_salina.3